MSNNNSRLSSFFELNDHDTNARIEGLAGLTTFLAMSYIIVVNPAILGQAIEIPGHTDGEIIQMLAIVTILASIAGIVPMALYAKRPFGLAPGMGSNAFFAFTVVILMGIPWQTALAAVFVEGILFMVLTAIGARKYIVELIPEPVKFTIGAGIGVFLLFVGLQEMQVVTASEGTLVTLGDIAQNPVALVALLGLAVTILLHARGVKGSIVIGILGTTLLGWLLTVADFIEPGVLAPEQIPSPHYDITPLMGAFVDGFYQIEPATFVLVLFTFFILDFFSTAGTLLGISQHAGFLDEEGNLPEMEKPLMADAIGTTVGAMLGTSVVSTYVESSAGIEEGGKTGLTSLVVGGLFLASLLLVPLIAAIPLYASHIALVLVGLIMLRGLADVQWDDPAWFISGGITIVTMPLTYSIAYGLAAGILSYPIVKTGMGEWRDVKPGQWALALLFVVYFYVDTAGVLM